MVPSTPVGVNKLIIELWKNNENTILRRQQGNCGMAGSSRFVAERIGRWWLYSFWSKGGLDQQGPEVIKKRRCYIYWSGRIYNTWSQNYIQATKVKKIGVILNVSYFLSQEKKLLNGLSNGPFIRLPIPGSIMSSINSFLSRSFIQVRMKYVILFHELKTVIISACNILPIFPYCFLLHKVNILFY